MKRSIAKDKLYKAIGKGERTSHKVSYITKADGSRFRRENANQHGNAEGGNDYVENRPNRTDLYPKDRRKKIMETGGKTPEEIAYEKEQYDAMFNSQYGKGSTVKGGTISRYRLVPYKERMKGYIESVGEKQMVVESTYEGASEKANELLYSDKDFVTVDIVKLGKSVLSSKKIAKINSQGIVKYAKGSTVKGKKTTKFIVFYNSKETGGMRERVFENENDANEFSKSVNGSVSPIKYKKGGKTPEEAYEQEQYDAMYDSTYGKGGKTGCWCYSIGGL